MKDLIDKVAEALYERNGLKNWKSIGVLQYQWHEMAKVAIGVVEANLGKIEREQSAGK
jgi:cell division protein FtsW (lipid II flippase)